MDLSKLTLLQGGPESVYASTVDIGLILVPSPVDLIEVSKNQPFNPSRRLEPTKLIEEVILSRRGGRTIYVVSSKSSSEWTT
jgi:hypothetical protein